MVYHQAPVCPERLIRTESLVTLEKEKLAPAELLLVV